MRLAAEVVLAQLGHLLGQKALELAVGLQLAAVWLESALALERQAEVRHLGLELDSVDYYLGS